MGIRKETRDIGELISDIAARKRRAAQARSLVTPQSTERPRDVFLSVCESIAASFANSGFRFAKSGPHCRKRVNDFVCQIAFSSSHHNVAGEHIALSIYGTVFSTKLKTWRQKYPFLNATDFVAGGQIGNLKTDASWITWELAEPERRDEVIRDAVAKMQELALPYFARFEDVASLIEFVVNNDLPAMPINCVIDLLLSLGKRQQARLAAERFLARHTHLRADYERELQSFSTAGIHRQPSGYAQQLAFASQVFEFGPLIGDGN